jgi:hypothetical protein
LCKDAGVKMEPCSHFELEGNAKSWLYMWRKHGPRKAKGK